MMLPKIFKLFSLVSTLVSLTLLAGCSDGGSSSGSSHTSKTFVGKATYTDTLIDADITLRDTAGQELYKTRGATSGEGLYAVSGVPLPESFTIEITGGKTPDGRPFNGYLKRIVASYEPNGVYEVNGLTTLVAVFMGRNPTASYESAVTAVRTYLGLPDAATFAQVSSMIAVADAWFSGRKFWDSVIGDDYDAFINSIMADIKAGKTVSFADETLTADLQPVLDSAKWNFSGSSAMAAKKTVKKAAVPVGEILEVAFDIIDDIEAEADSEENKATLNRIDENIQAMQQQLMTISSQLNTVTSLLTLSAFETVNSKLRPLELGCISPALTAYQNMVEAKRTKNSNFNDFKNTFISSMERKSCSGTYIDSFDTVLRIYADEVTRLDDPSQAAIQLFTNVINTKSNTNSDKASYQALEDAFNRFISYQAAALQLHVQYEVYKYGLTLKNETPSEKKRKIDVKKEDLIKGFLEGPAEYGKKRMIIQIQRFVPAVETFVVSHNSEHYYRRWLVCDTMNSYVQDPSGGKCEEKERPFLRSQIITDQLLGGISTEGYKYGLFVKSIQFDQSGVDFQHKNFIVGMPDGSNKTISPVETKELTGKHPYIDGDVKWYLATYKIDTIPSSGPLTFDLSKDTNDTATPLVFRRNLSLKSVQNSTLSEYYYAFNLWTVPVKDVGFYTKGINMFTNEFPVQIADCDNERCWTVRTSGNRADAPAKLRLYKVGPQAQDGENVAIGYSGNGRRQILLPGDDDKWVGWCNNNQSLYAFAEKDMIVGGVNRIYWLMQQDPGGAMNVDYSVSFINADNTTKYIIFGNNGWTSQFWAYYGWNNCAGITSGAVKVLSYGDGKNISDVKWK